MTTQFRPDTTFPYLKIAREYNVPYGRVIRFIQRVDEEWSGQKLFTGEQPPVAWHQAACIAWITECNRRSMVVETNQLNGGPTQ